MDRGAKLEAAERFPNDLLAQLHKSKILRIRAGTGDHRFIGIWVVVVKDRVFVRSWSVKPDGWYQTFLAEPHGAIRIGDRDIPVVAVRTRDKRILDAIDRAYLEKYNTPGAIKYARDLGSPQSRAGDARTQAFGVGPQILTMSGRPSGLGAAAPKTAERRSAPPSIAVL